MRAAPLPKLITLAALALAGGGCVVPMPIEAEPIEQNLPPYFFSDAVTPPFNLLVEFNPELDQSIEFRTGPIGDPNPDDRIFYRWFVNYQPSGRPPITDTGPPEGVSLTELAAGSIDLRLEPCAGNTFSRDVDLHTIEVVIADRPFIADGDDSPTPNQTLPVGAYKKRLVWFMRFDRSNCP